MNLKSAVASLFLFTIIFPIFSLAQNNQNLKRYLVLYKKPVVQFGGFFTKSLRQNIMIESSKQAEQQVFAALETNSYQIEKTVWIAHGTLAKMTSGAAAQLKKNTVVADVIMFDNKNRFRFSPNEPLNLNGQNVKMTYGLQQLNIEKLNLNFPGVNGSGVRVGVIDTGVDDAHPDLKGKVLAFKDFTGGPQKPYDNHSHGTHVSGTIAGGASSGTQIGVAPAAKLIVARTFNMFGSFEVANLLLAMQWVADPDENPETDDGIHLLNGSWNVDGDTKNFDPALAPFCRAVDGLKSIEILSVFAAGNDGPASSSIFMPGACPNALTVASNNSSSIIAEDSSRGPVIWKNGISQKPEITAPGVSVYSAAPKGEFKTKSGTSMATPHVVGVMALLTQMQMENGNQAPLHSPHIFELVYETAVPLQNQTGWNPNSGFGRIDAFQLIHHYLNPAE